MQRLRDEPVRVERVGELVDLDSRPAEHDRRLGALEIQDAAERVDLLPPPDDVGHLPDARHLARRALLLRDLDLGRALQMPAGDGENTRRKGRGKQRRLAGLRRLRDDRVDIFREAHVEHLIGFIEHEHFDLRQVQRGPAQMVERPSGRGDNHLGAAPERADLVIHRRAAVERHHGEIGALRVLVERFGHLHRQLASRDQHERARLVRGCALSRVRRSSSGKAKAAVLPVPVAAWPSMSPPVSNTGMASR